MDETKIKYKFLFIVFICIYLLASCFANTVQAENDTATTTNILPNNNVTSSSRDNFDLDGVASSTETLTNNSTHSGFTITCETQVDNACGRAYTGLGEIEGSHDIKVSASDTLIGIDGTESSTTYTTTQKKIRRWDTIKFILFCTKL